MYTIKIGKNVVEKFDKFDEACRKARILGNLRKEAVSVWKGVSELYRTR